VTHPFHPLCDKEFDVADRRRAWGEDRVYFFDASGNLKRLPTAWTSAAAPDPFVVVAQGRALVRVEDLLALFRIVSHEAEEERGAARRVRGAGVSRK
jgi:hypothetical protein